MNRILVISFIAILLSGCSSSNSYNNKVTELYNESNYAAAIPFAEKALIFAEKEFGKAHQNYGTSLGNLALIYKEIGQ